METSHEIPKGLAFESIKSEEVQPIPSHISEQNVEVNMTDPLDGVRKPAHQHRTSVQFRKRSSRTEIGDKYKTKAVSQHYQLSEKKQTILEELEEKVHQKIEKVVPQKTSKKNKKYKEPIKLPPTNKKQIIHTQPIELAPINHNKGHHFNRKQYHNQKILKDIDKHPIKYKIMCQVFGCKPDEAYQMHKDQTSHVQEQYTKQKGLEYLRQANAKAKYSYVRDQRSKSNNHRQRFKTESISKMRKYREEASTQTPSQPKNKIKISKSQKLIKLSSKEAAEGKKVYDRVKKHLNHNQYNDNYFKHLSSEESIDNALVNFLKTKIKKAEVVLK